MRGDAPADDHPGVRVGDEAHVGHTGPGRYECQVGEPQRIRRRRGEVAPDQIKMPRCFRVGFGGAYPFAPARSDHPGGPHVPGHLIAPDVMTSAAGGFPQLACPVDAVVVRPQLFEGSSSRCVAAHPRRWGPGFGRVVGARGHPHACRSQDGADGLDPEFLAVGVDERDYFLCWRSSSAPKKLAARFKISLARLSSRISCSSSLTRADSMVARPGSYPSSMSAWRTHERTDSTP